MDLAERGHRSFRRAVLQAWTETLGDFASLGLLTYYEAYRALVRAKVSALTALQLPADAPQRLAAVATCERYLAWARERLGPRRPALIVTCGLSGSGKTWLARLLAPEFDALHVRSDVERKRLAGLAPLEESQSAIDGGLYTREFNARTYERLRECAEAALAAGESIVVDAACLRREERAAFLELASRCSAPAAIVHCTAPEPVLRERVAARLAARDDASEAGLEVLAQQREWWEPFDTGEMPHVVTVDTAARDPVARALDGIRGRTARRRT
jgi:predicted kinase